MTYSLLFVFIHNRGIYGFRKKYAIYDKGEYNYYKYDTKEKTFQFFDITEKKHQSNNSSNSSKNNSNIFLVTTIVFALTTCVAVGYILIKGRKTNEIS